MSFALILVAAFSIFLQFQTHPVHLNTTEAEVLLSKYHQGGVQVQPPTAYPYASELAKTTVIAQTQAIEAKKAEEARLAAVAAAEAAKPAPQRTYSGSDVPTLPVNEAMLFIFNHESGNNPKRWNSEGCVGLGQACPASKLLAVCPNLDYDCEVVFFTNYANSRYGGWQGAYAYWLAHHWW